MKVLIVDDDKKKIEQLVSHLTLVCGLLRDDIHICFTGFDARQFLVSNRVDLLILDIVLPFRAETQPSAKHSLSLLEDLAQGRKLKKPTQIVGLTAYEEAAKEVAPKFSRYLWTVIHYDSSSTEWLVQIEGCVSYLAAAAADRTPPKYDYDYDLCVINALHAPEASSIHNLAWNWKPAIPMDDTTFFRPGSISAQGSNYKIAAVTAPKMGMVATALIASKAIELLRPKVLVMTGICAGVQEKVNLGDVILAESAWDYQSGKHKKEGDNSTFDIDSHQIGIPAQIRSCFIELSGDNALLSTIRSSYPECPSTVIKLHSGPIASGSAVLEDSDIIMEIRDRQNRKLLGVDMEIYGLYAAAHLARTPRPVTFAIKSVCDFGDSNKNDSMQKYAAHTSSQVLKALMDRYIGTIVAAIGS